MDGKNIRGRFAPSPTGLMHIGNARTALAAWLSIRSQEGIFVWRLEDLDTPRVVQGMSEAAAEDLFWLGIDWDEGPGKGGDLGPYKQSARFNTYEKALDTLLEAGRIFPCAYSRKDLQTLASAPHGAGASFPYPITLRPQQIKSNWLNELQAGELKDSKSPYASIRFKVNSGIVSFYDEMQGEVQQNVLEEIGDFVVKRRDGMYAYQLAVVVDDIAMEISEIVRGADLLDSTARQIQLMEALGGGAIPKYAHVPLVLNHQGEKLSKRDKGLTLRSLQEAGVTPEQLVGYLAFSLGLINKITPIQPGALIKNFHWEKITNKDWVLPADLAAILLAV